MKHRPATPFLIAFSAGFLLWLAASAISGRREAWDAAIYWTLAYPLAIVAAGLLGYFYPQRPWRWAVVLFAAQFLAMCVREGELGSLWPLGMLAFLVIALPAVLAAKLAAGRSPEADGN